MRNLHHDLTLSGLFFLDDFYRHSERSIEMIDTKQQILTFIENIREQGKSMETCFGRSYSWHFARLLQITFGRGILCLAEPKPYILWLDHDGTTYDIFGEYDRKEEGGTSFTDLRFLGSLTRVFQQIPGLFYEIPESIYPHAKAFHVWANTLELSDGEAMLQCYLNLPSFEKEYAPHHTVIETMYPGITAYQIPVEDMVLPYWRTHREVLQEHIKRMDS